MTRISLCDSVRLGGLIRSRLALVRRFADSLNCLALANQNKKLCRVFAVIVIKGTVMSGEDCDAFDRGDNDSLKPDKMFTLKKWNAVAMWSWDVECDTCAICRVQVMDACLRCQGESNKKDSYGKQDCVVVWGECNHSFHFCCMSLWVKQNNRCPLCQQEWSIQRMGK